MYFARVLTSLTRRAEALRNKQSDGLASTDDAKYLRELEQAIGVLSEYDDDESDGCDDGQA